LVRRGILAGPLDEATHEPRQGVRIPGIRQPAIGRQLQPRIHASALRLADVGKKCAPLRDAVDEGDVVVEVGLEERYLVGQSYPRSGSCGAARTGFHRVRDDLLEMRVADEEVRQAAGVLRARARKLGWG